MAEEFLIPSKRREESWSELVLHLDVPGENLDVGDSRDFKTCLERLGPDLKVVPRVADFLRKYFLPVVVEVASGRQERLCFGRQIGAGASRNSERPCGIGAICDAPADRGMLPLGFVDAPVFRSRGKRLVLEFDGVFE